MVAGPVAVAVVGGGDEHPTAQERARAERRVGGRLTPARQDDDEGEGRGARRALRLEQCEHVHGSRVHEAVDEGRVGREGAARGLEGQAQGWVGRTCRPEGRVDVRECRAEARQVAVEGRCEALEAHAEPGAQHAPHGRPERRLVARALQRRVAKEQREDALVQCRACSHQTAARAARRLRLLRRGRLRLGRRLLRCRLLEVRLALRGALPRRRGWHRLVFRSVAAVQRAQLGVACERELGEALAAREVQGVPVDRHGERRQRGGLAAHRLLPPRRELGRGRRRLGAQRGRHLLGRALVEALPLQVVHQRLRRGAAAAVGLARQQREGRRLLSLLARLAPRRLLLPRRAEAPALERQRPDDHVRLVRLRELAQPVAQLVARGHAVHLERRGGGRRDAQLAVDGHGLGPLGQRRGEVPQDHLRHTSGARHARGSHRRVLVTLLLLVEGAAVRRRLLDRLLDAVRRSGRLLLGLLRRRRLLARGFLLHGLLLPVSIVPRHACSFVLLHCGLALVLGGEDGR
eukprot:scaffold81114_cov59-Phaeocystis_antarctica.AAC.10